MIKDLTVKLMEEAGSEANHKALCDAELATNAHMRKVKTEQVEMLTAEINQLQASFSQLAEEIKELTDAAAALDAALAKTTKVARRDARDAREAPRQVMDKRTALEKEEMSSKSAFDVMVIDLKGQIKQAEQDLSEKKALRAMKLAEKANNEAEFAETISTLNADTNYPAEVKAAFR